MAFNYKGVDLPYQQYSTQGNAAQWLVEAFQRSFSRNPTQNEIAMLLPAYDPSNNVTNVGSGDAAVAAYFQQKNPNADAKQGAPEKYGEIDSLFSQYLGRQPTNEEKDHFATLLASGQYSAYDIGQALQNLPENVRKQDEEFRKSLSADLQAGDARYFNEQIMPGIQSNFAKQGRTVEATGFQNALAQAATQQNRERESFLANLSARQYEGNKANAYEDYIGNRDYARGRSDFLADRNQQRLYGLADFQMQRDAYDAYLRRFGKRSNGQGIGSLAGGAIGGGLGAFFGGPAGAYMGYTIGSGVGGGAGSFF